MLSLISSRKHTNQWCLVNGTAFNTTFNSPGATILGLMVAILEGNAFITIL
jgi:hypothetical protein